MMDDAVRNGVIGATVAVTLMAIFRAAKKEAVLEGESRDAVLEYGPVLRAIGWIGAVGMPLGIVALVLFVPFKNPNDPYIAAGAMLFFAVLGGALLMETRGVRITISDEGIRGVSPWRREVRFIPWHDVAEVRYSGVNSWFVIRNMRGEKIRANLLLSGLGTMARAIRAKLPPEIYAKAESGFGMVESK